MKKLLTLLFAVALAFSLSTAAFAQEGGADKDKKETAKMEKKEKKAAHKGAKKEKKEMKEMKEKKDKDKDKS